jgi:dTDP-4-dehydrorhamnose 3,5-epimerase
MTQKKSDIIDGLIIIEPYVFYDFRGEYVETFNSSKYEFYDKNNELIIFKEDDLSISRKNVIKGLHGDDRTWKLVQCVFGSFYLVVVDYRASSPTYLRHQTFSLNDKNRTQVLIPSGCANGHLCLSDYCVFSYKQSSSYRGSDAQFTLRWNDPDLGIYWPISNPILSVRDSECPNFLEKR